MRPIGRLDCQDCGGRHDVHVNRAGQLVSLVSCPASSEGFLGPVAQNRLQEQLDQARRELSAAAQLFDHDRVNYMDVSAQLDEVHRRLVMAQNTILEHSRSA